MTNKFESKCLQKSTLQVNREKECYRKTTSYLVSVPGVWKGRERGLRETRNARSAPGYTWVYMGIQGIQGDKHSITITWRIYLFGVSVTWKNNLAFLLEQPSLHFCQHFMRGTTQHTFLAINLASQQKTTKPYFSSRVRKQFKLLTVPFKPLRCCLRKDKLVKNAMSENSAKIYF